MLLALFHAGHVSVAPDFIVAPASLPSLRAPRWGARNDNGWIATLRSQ